MCLVKRTRRIVGDVERCQTTTYFCSRSRNGQTCSLTRHEEVEKRYQQSSSTTAIPGITRRQTTIKPQRDGIWRRLGNSFSGRSTTTPRTEEVRDNDKCRQQASNRAPATTPPVLIQNNILPATERSAGSSAHRRIVSEPVMVERVPRDIAEQVRPVTEPAPRPPRPPRSRTPVDDRPRRRRPQQISVHQPERPEIRVETVEVETRRPERQPERQPDIRLERQSERQPERQPDILLESEVDDHFSTFATFNSSSTSSSSSESPGSVTHIEDETDEPYDESDESLIGRERHERTVFPDRDREYLYAQLEAIEAQRRAESATQERREIENLANDMRHALLNRRNTSVARGARTRGADTRINNDKERTTSAGDGDGDEDVSDNRRIYRRHSTVMARRSSNPSSYLVQEERRRLREESERVFEDARARRDARNRTDSHTHEEGQGRRRWRQSYYQ